MAFTTSHIEELSQLLKELGVERYKDGLINHDEKTNPNFKFLQRSILEQKFEEKLNEELGEMQLQLTNGFVGCALEGSSRAGKTWAGIDIIIWICLFVETKCTINIYRETYNEFKTTLYDDFKRRLNDFGLDNPFEKTKEIKSFQINGNTIYFLGDGKHGGGCDYAFYNEIMEIPEQVFMQSKMRCRKFWWADYNPSYTDHWFFDKVLSRDDVGFLRTTYKDNPYITANEYNEIKGYEPWLPGSYEIRDDQLFYKGNLINDDNTPPPHPKNHQVTADEYMWKVYGLGLKGSMKGTIFPVIHWIDEFPEDVGHMFGNDFGFTVDPNALTKYHEDGNNIYMEPLAYRPIETAVDLGNEFLGNGIGADTPVVCDSSDKYTGQNKGTVEMVDELDDLGFKGVFKVSKTKSVMYWLLSMKKKKIHVVKNKFYKQIKKERENYKFKEVQGIQVNQPIDKYNHFFDSGRYCHMVWNDYEGVKAEYLD